MKLVKEFMKKKVIKFKPDDNIFKVAKIFSQKNISGAPVVIKGRVVGIISETDIIKFMRIKMPKKEVMSEEPHILSLLILSMIKDHLQFKKELKRISKIKVKDLMSNKVISIKPDEAILDAAARMQKYDVNRLPVIEKGKLKGILARADLIRALIK